MFVLLNATGGHPGGGVSQFGGVDRYAIAAYTLSSGGATFITDSFLSMVSFGSAELRIGIGSTFAPSTPIFVNSLSSVPFNMSLGNLVAGDTIYFAVGPNRNDSFDTFSWDFTIRQEATVPEPPILSLLCFGLVGLAARKARNAVKL